MALNADSILKVGTAAFYTADIGTPKPTLTGAEGPSEPWEHMGHSSIDEILTSSSEGGERVPLPTLQAQSGARFSVSARTDTFTINLHQFDEKSLKLYYGANAVVNADGSIDIPTSPIATESAWLFMFRDGNRVGGLYAARASIIRADDFSINDTESLARLSLAVTPMEIDGSTGGSALSFIPPFDVTKNPEG